MSNKEKIGLLLRVSTKVQETDGTSLDVQKKMGLKLSKELGFEPIIFNEGSQTSFRVEIEERVVLVELLDEIKKGNIHHIWVFNSDRLGRNSNSWFSIYKILLDCGVKIYVGTSKKPFDLEFPIDELNMGILSLVSQYDNRLRRMRSVLGKRNSLKSGNTFVGGTKPFGYDVRKKMLVVNDEESKVVKKMYEMYSSGKSTMDIKYYLDVKTDFEPKRSKNGWNLGTIQKMLGSSLYKGEQKWEWKEKVRGEFKVVDVIKIKTPKIIPIKLWNDVQKKLEKNNINQDNRKKNHTLFDGLMYCKSCNTKLSIRTKSDSIYDLYSCRIVEYKWKNPQKWETKHKNCSLKKSVRVGSTDEVMISHLIGILKESKRVRENFKLKSLTPKFEDIGNVKKEKTKKEKYLSEKKRYKEKLEESIVDTEVKIITSEVSKSVGKKMKERINLLISEVEQQIYDLEREIGVLGKSKEWIDWLNQMYLEVESLETLPMEQQRTFVRNYLKRIDVEYVPSIKSHRFHFEFLYPIVEDGIRMVGKGKSGRREYDILDGSTKSILEHKQSNSKHKISVEEKDVLDKIISKLRVEESLSLSRVCEELNSKGFKTPTNKTWDKPKLSSYIKHMKIDVGKS